MSWPYESLDVRDRLVDIPSTYHYWMGETISKITTLLYLDSYFKKVPFKITNYQYKTSSSICKVCMFRWMSFDWKVQWDVNLTYKSRFQWKNIYSCPWWAHPSFLCYIGRFLIL